MLQTDIRALECAPLKFHDRREAGRVLADALGPYSHTDSVVLGIPRGGMPVAMEVAEALSLPFDVVVVQRIALPVHCAWEQRPWIGGVARQGVKIIDWERAARCRVSSNELEQAVASARGELERREKLYRDECPFPYLATKSVILVDDGLETGLTMRTALAAVRTLRPRRIVVAIPVGRATVCDELAGQVHEVLCTVRLAECEAIHSRYEDFPKVTDEEVRVFIEAQTLKPAV